MARPKSQRKPTVSVWLSDKDERWHAHIVVGTKPDGRPDRRHRKNKDKQKVVDAILELEDMREAGAVPPAGIRHTVETWLPFWLDKIAPMRAGYSTMKIRKWAVNQYLIPRLGGHDLTALATSHIEDMYFTLHLEGLSPKSIQLIHETLMLALSKAEDHHFMRINPAATADRPAVVETEVEPLSAAEAVRVLEVVKHRRSYVRWLLGFLGIRQGEVLGLRWDDIEEDVIAVSSKAQRRTYEHGCADPVACAARNCVTGPCEGPWEHGCQDPEKCARPHCNKALYPSQIRRGNIFKPCPPGCTKHAKACPDRRKGPCRKNRHKTCPPLCPEGCTGHAKACPQRVGGIMLTEPEPIPTDTGEAGPRRKGSRRATKRGKRLSTKTTAGNRRVGIPEDFMDALREHRQTQDAERRAAGSKWQDNGLVVCSEFGQPIDRSADWREWAQILEESEVEHLPLHGARHTAATLLLAAGVDRRIVMDIMGWSDEKMLKRYQHVADELRREAAGSLGAMFGGSATRNATRDNVIPFDRDRRRASLPTFPLVTRPYRWGE